MEHNYLNIFFKIKSRGKRGGRVIFIRRRMELSAHPEDEEDKIKGDKIKDETKKVIMRLFYSVLNCKIGRASKVLRRNKISKQRG